LDANKRVCAVEVLHAPASATSQDKPAQPESDAKRGAGPVRVSNEKYRQNWNVIFGSKDNASDGEWSLN
jgi:hypothetical protein